MPHLLRIACFLLLVSLAGCSFNRADFVCGSNGKPKDGELSDDGKAVGEFLKGGPHLALKY